MTIQPKHSPTPRLDRFFSGSAPLVAELATAKALLNLTGSDEFRHRRDAAVNAFLAHAEKVNAKFENFFANGAFPE